MERKEQTTAAALAIGDRFYRVNDRNRRILQVVKNPVRVSKSIIHCVNAELVDKRLPADRIKFYSVPMAGTTQVVFLRSTANEKAN